MHQVVMVMWAETFKTPWVKITLHVLHKHVEMKTWFVVPNSWCISWHDYRWLHTRDMGGPWKREVQVWCMTRDASSVPSHKWQMEFEGTLLPNALIPFLSSKGKRQKTMKTENKRMVKHTSLSLDCNNHWIVSLYIEWYIGTMIFVPISGGYTDGRKSPYNPASRIHLKWKSLSLWIAAWTKFQAFYS